MTGVARRSAGVEFLRGPPLAGTARRTFRLHLAYALLDATAGGGHLAERADRGDQSQPPTEGLRFRFC